METPMSEYWILPYTTMSYRPINKHRFFFCGGRGSNPGPCLYYALSKPIELCLRGQTLSIKAKMHFVEFSG